MNDTKSKHDWRRDVLGLRHVGTGVIIRPLGVSGTRYISLANGKPYRKPGSRGVTVYKSEAEAKRVIERYVAAA